MVSTRMARPSPASTCLWSAGITYHGAHSRRRRGDRVLVRLHVRRPSGARSATSPALNFHCLFGLSSRAMKRRFCSAFETCRKNLTTLRAVAVEVALEGVEVVVALGPEGRPAVAGGQLLLVEPLGVDLQRDDLLVVRAVEDADAARARARPCEIRHRNVWSSSSLDGCLNDTTCTPCGLTPDMTCSIVESLPAASIAWNTTSSGVRVARPQQLLGVLELARCLRRAPAWRRRRASWLERSSYSPPPVQLVSRPAEVGGGARRDAQRRRWTRWPRRALSIDVPVRCSRRARGARRGGR